MEFIVTDRIGIKTGVRVRAAYVVISIHDPDSPKPRVKRQPGLRAVLQLMFDDAEPTDSGMLNERVTLMSAEQARQVWDFVQQHRHDVGAVVVHCEAGMSRSPAVAAALCKALVGDNRRFWQEYQPNEYVYRLVLAAAKGKTT